MKKLSTIAAAAIATGALATTAFAQTAPVELGSAGSKITPSKAGTKKKPVNGKVQSNVSVNAEAKATLGNIVYTTDKGVKVSGKGFPTCADEVLVGGGADCPAKSKVGSGTATALLSGNGQTVNFVFGIYVGGASKISLVLTTDDLPGFVKVFPGKISGSKIDVTIPKEAQQPAPGLFAYLTSIKASLGAKTLKKGGKKYNFVGLQGCSGKKHTLKQTLTFVDQVRSDNGQTVAKAPAPESVSSSFSCKK